MTDETIRAKLSGIRCFLLDMDGTFYLGDRIIPGRTGISGCAGENGAHRALPDEQLQPLRLDVCRKVGADGRSGGVSRRDYIRTSGGAVLPDALSGQNRLSAGESRASGGIDGHGAALRDSDDADYVLAAFDTTLDYGKLCRVCDLIRTGKPYIATHPDFNCPTEHGFIPDLGAFMALIHASTGRWADVVIGKPNRGIVDEALARTGFALHEMAMVGDRLYTDVATGVNHGMTGILVLSGEAKRSDVDTSDVKPDLIFGRLSDIIPYL